MSYTRKAVYGIGIIILFHLVAALLGYAFRFVLARKLGVEQYGLFFSVLAFFFLFSTVKDLGIGNALVITLPKLQLKKKWETIKNTFFITYGFKLAFAGILAILFWLLAPLLAQYLFKTSEATPLLRIMSMVFFLSVNEEMLGSTFLGFQKHTYYACIELLTKTLLLAFLFFFIHKGIHAPVLAYLSTALLLPVLLLPSLYKVWPKSAFRYSWKPLKPLLLLGLPFVLNTLTYSIVSYFDTLMLTSMRSLHEVGLYNAALPTAMAVLYFMYAFDSVLQPLSAELYHARKKDKLSLGLGLLHKYLFIGILPLIFVFILYAPSILQLFYGTEYVAGTAPLQILMIGVLFYAIALTNLSVLSGIGQPKKVAKIMLFAAISNVVLNLIFIPSYGMIGAAFTTVLSYTLALFLSFVQLKKHLSLQVPWKNWMKTLLCGILFILVLSLSTSLWIQIILILLGLVLYILLLFLFRTLNLEEIKMLWKELAR